MTTIVTVNRRPVVQPIESITITLSMEDARTLRRITFTHLAGRELDNLDYKLADAGVTPCAGPVTIFYKS
jgi:hypothetical protein